MTALALTLLLLGTALATRGLIGRRIGDEPRCRKCKYNLTGVESKECPECGRAWTLQTAARGLRVRRRVPIAFGTVLCAFGGILLTPIAQRRLNSMNWFEYLPTRWVLPAAQRGNWRALWVIKDRFYAGQLSIEDSATLTQFSLDIQANTSPSSIDAVWVDMLASLDAQDRLSAEQRRRFYDQMLRFKLVVRPTIRRGDRLPADLTWTTHAPWNAPLSMEWKLVEARIDDDKVTPEADWLVDASGPISGCNEINHPMYASRLGLSPGTYTFEIDSTARLLSHDPADYDKVRELWAKQLTLTATFAVLADDAGDSIEILRDEESGERLRASLAVAAKIYKIAGRPSQLSVYAWYVSGHPHDAVYDIDVITPDGVRRQAGRHQQWGGTSRASYPDGLAEFVNVGDEITVILRFDRALARDMPGITRMWEGEIAFEHIKVAEEKLTPSPGASTGPPTNWRMAGERYSPPQISRTPPKPELVGPPLPLRFRTAARLRSLVNAVTPAPTSQRATAH